MKPFSLLIKPAAADCNLRCEYCFYLDKCRLYPESPRHRMSDAVLERMITSYMATGQPQYTFGWQGGEPTLMGVDFFRRVTELQQKHGRPGAVVGNGLQTNATLVDDALAAHLAEYKFLLGVSMDGPAEVHDRYRLTVAGAGSHGAVWQGIRALQRHQVEFNILTLVSQSNVLRPAETYEYLVSNGFLFHQYIPCVEFDAAGGCLPFAISGPQWGDFLCGIFDAWYARDRRRVSVRQFDAILERLVLDRAAMCTMGTDCCQYLVVEWNGDVYPCDFFVVPELRLGNVMTHSWEQLLASPVYHAFGRRKREWSGACAACPHLDLCAGDCQKHRFAGGCDPRKLSHLCDGWRQFYGHARAKFAGLAAELRAARQAAVPPPPRPAAPAKAPGRNDPCLCGSGRKFKLCHGR